MGPCLLNGTMGDEHLPDLGLQRFLATVDPRVEIPKCEILPDEAREIYKLLRFFFTLTTRLQLQSLKQLFYVTLYIHYFSIGHISKQKGLKLLY